MSQSNSKTITHAEIWDVIPWFVNGRATADECARVEIHLQSCAQCRDEVAVQRHVYSSVARDTGIECVPSVSLQRLWSRIDAEREDSAPDRPSALARLRGKSNGTAPRSALLTRWLIAALTIESVALAALVLAVGVSLHRSAPSAIYRTVSTPTQVSAAASIRAVFAPAMSLERLQELLQDTQLHIVSGPTEAGVYSLAPLNAGQAPATARSLSRLRENPDVRFAESTRPPP